MSDLHAVLTARIDELERIAKDAHANAPGPWGYLMPSMELVDLNLDPVADVRSDPAGWQMAVWDPATVLRGLAEDRDILRRHYLADYRLEDDVQPYCACCGHEPTDGEPYCPDVLSLARRHGLEV